MIVLVRRHLSRRGQGFLICHGRLLVREAAGQPVLVDGRRRVLIRMLQFADADLELLRLRSGAVVERIEFANLLQVAVVFVAEVLQCLRGGDGLAPAMERPEEQGQQQQEEQRREDVHPRAIDGHRLVGRVQFFLRVFEILGQRGRIGLALLQVGPRQLELLLRLAEFFLRRGQGVGLFLERSRERLFLGLEVPDALQENGHVLARLVSFGGRLRDGVAGLVKLLLELVAFFLDFFLVFLAVRELLLAVDEFLVQRRDPRLGLLEAAAAFLELRGQFLEPVPRVVQFVLGLLELGFEFADAVPGVVAFAFDQFELLRERLAFLRAGFELLAEVIHVGGEAADALAAGLQILFALGVLHDDGASRQAAPRIADRGVHAAPAARGGRGNQRRGRQKAARESEQLADAVTSRRGLHCTHLKKEPRGTRFAPAGRPARHVRG